MGDLACCYRPAKQTSETVRTAVSPNVHRAPQSRPFGPSTIREGRTITKHQNRRRLASHQEAKPLNGPINAHSSCHVGQLPSNILITMQPIRILFDVNTAYFKLFNTYFKGARLRALGPHASWSQCQSGHLFRIKRRTGCSSGKPGPVNGMRSSTR